MKNKKQITIYLDEDVNKKIEEKAKGKDRSVNYIINEILKKAVK